MITITKKNGNVYFLNETEYSEVEFRKDEKKVIAWPIQNEASLGFYRQVEEFEDVGAICYTNNAHPTNLIFYTDDQE